MVSAKSHLFVLRTDAFDNREILSPSQGWCCILGCDDVAVGRIVVGTYRRSGDLGVHGAGARMYITSMRFWVLKIATSRLEALP